MPEVKLMQNTVLKSPLDQLYSLRKEYRDITTEISDLKNFITIVNEMCGDLDLSSCDSLQRDLASHYHKQHDESVIDWPTLVAASQKQTFKNSITVSIFDGYVLYHPFLTTTTSLLNHIEKKLFSIVQHNTNSDKQITLDIITRNSNSNNSINHVNDNEQDPLFVKPYQTPPGNEDWSAQIAKVFYLYDIIKQKSNQPFSVTGMVTNLDDDINGNLTYLEINTRMMAQQSQGLLAISALLSFLFVAIAIMTLIQFALMIKRVFSNLIQKNQ